MHGERQKTVGASSVTSLHAPPDSEPIIQYTMAATFSRPAFSES
jgi:hypothetical protein